MKNIRENKGITLIALIITIIVLLILAAVTISAVNEGNLFSHANNAATAYSEAATEENTMISRYLEYMDNFDSGETNVWKTKYHLTTEDMVYGVIYREDGGSFEVGLRADGAIYASSGSLGPAQVEAAYNAPEGSNQRLGVTSNSLTMYLTSDTIELVIGNGKINFTQIRDGQITNTKVLLLTDEPIPNI